LFTLTLPLYQSYSRVLILHHHHPPRSRDPTLRFSPCPSQPHSDPKQILSTSPTASSWTNPNTLKRFRTLFSLDNPRQPRRLYLDRLFRLIKPEQTPSNRDLDRSRFVEVEVPVSSGVNVFAIFCLLRKPKPRQPVASNGGYKYTRK